MNHQNKNIGSNQIDPTKHWTENKHYIQASFIDISTKFSKNNYNEDYMMKYNDVCSSAFKWIPKDDKLDYFVEYRQNILNTYSQVKVKKETFEKLKRILIEISSNDSEINETIKEIKFDETNNLIDPIIFKFCNRYKYSIFRSITFKSLLTNDQQKLKFYLDECEKQTNLSNRSKDSNKISQNFNTTLINKQFKDINNAYDDVSNNFKPNNNNQYNYNQFKITDNHSNDFNPNNEQQQLIPKQPNESSFNLIDLDDFKKVAITNSNVSNVSNVSEPRNISVELNEGNSINRILLDEFRKAVGHKGATDEVCMSYLLSSNNNVLESTKLYFQDKYGCKSLKIIFILPDKKEIQKEFNFIDSPDDLFLFLFNDPNINNPSLFLGNRKIEINPIVDKYIGNLYISNNSRLIVKSD